MPTIQFKPASAAVSSSRALVAVSKPRRQLDQNTHGSRTGINAGSHLTAAEPKTFYSRGLVVTMVSMRARSSLGLALRVLQQAMQSKGAHSGSLLVPTCTLRRFNAVLRTDMARNGINIEHVARPSTADAERLLQSYAAQLDDLDRDLHPDPDPAEGSPRQTAN